jgi:F-type H+-transporting ATPase subunit delta
VRDTTVARSYAEALYELAEKNGLHAEIESSIGALDAAFADAPILRDFLASPKIEAASKKATLRKALEGRVHPVFINFLMVLINKRRQRLLLEVGAQYRALVDERQGRLHVQVTLARQPADNARADLTQQLGRALDREVVPHIVVNPEILGGVILRYGDRVLDGSLRRRLISMRRRLLEAGAASNR